MRTSTVLLCVGLLTSFQLAFSQDAPAHNDTSSPSPTSSRLLLDNDYVRVVQQPSPTGIISKKNDSVVIAISPDSSRAADIKFVSRGSVIAQDSGKAEWKSIVIELKRHWDAPIRVCGYPMQCTHKVEPADVEVSETTSLFTNGFITASKHRVFPGGTLSSSYFSPKGSDHIVFVSLSALDASFDGIDEKLAPGQVYFSDAAQVEVTAGDHDGDWIVIRLNTPKP